MAFIDIIFILIIAGYGMFGLWFGLVHTFGSLSGTLAGAYFAGLYYEPLGSWLVHITGWEQANAEVLMFVLAFIMINRLIGFGFWIVDRLTKIITMLPFIGGLNRLLGGLLGLFEGAITIGLILYVIDTIPLSEAVMAQLEVSVLAPKLVLIASILIPLLPDALTYIDSGVHTAGEAVSDFVQESVTSTP